MMNFFRGSVAVEEETVGHSVFFKQQQMLHQANHNQQTNQQYQRCSNKIQRERGRLIADFSLEMEEIGRKRKRERERERERGRRVERVEMWKDPTRLFVFCLFRFFFLCLFCFGLVFVLFSQNGTSPATRLRIFGCMDFILVTVEIESSRTPLPCVVNLRHGHHSHLLPLSIRIHSIYPAICIHDTFPYITVTFNLIALLPIQTCSIQSNNRKKYAPDPNLTDWCQLSRCCGLNQSISSIVIGH